MTRSSPDDRLDAVRALCRGFPEAVERLSHGAPAFFVRAKTTFVMYMDDHHGDGRLALWCAAGPGDQGLLIDSDPRAFFVPPYVGHQGWIGVRLDVGLDWDVVVDVVEEAYRAVAPRRLVDLLDAYQPDAPG